MAFYIEQIYRWLPEENWDQWICPGIKQVCEILERDGITVVKVAEENYKSPTGVVFVSQAFDPATVIEALDTSCNIKASQVFANTLVCNTHFSKITFEKRAL